jgi:hypothetical protein
VRLWVQVKQGRIFVTALSDTAGTFLDGTRLSMPDVGYVAEEGVVITFGQGLQHLTFFYVITFI